MDLHAETRLILAAQAGDTAAAETLLAEFAPAIKAAARRYGAALGEDAEQEATCAFLELVRGFDTYGGLRLAQVVARSIAPVVAAAAAGEEALTIPPREYRRFLALLASAGGDVSAAAELATGGRHGLTRTAFLAILAATRGTDSLDAGLGEEVPADSRPMHSVWRPTQPTDAEIADAHFALGVLGDRERMLCKLAYGFVEDRAMSDAEVAERMPVPTVRGRAWTQQSVNRTRNAALAVMREALA